MQRQLTVLEERVHNAGERLIPGVTQDTAELIRHRSSYLFFKRAIELDLAHGIDRDPTRILDIGCGVGHGCCTLAEIPGSLVLGIDNSREAIEYARAHYAGSNVEYEVAELAEYVDTMQEFDYVVSRGALEHIPRGIELAHSSKWRLRLVFDVPYDEPPGVNRHHVLHHVREDGLGWLENPEFFYQDLRGTYYGRRPRRPKPNMVLCVCRRPGLPRIGERIRFPVAPWTPAGWEWPTRDWSLEPFHVRAAHRAWLTIDWYLGRLRAMFR